MKTLKLFTVFGLVVIAIGYVILARYIFENLNTILGGLALVGLFVVIVVLGTLGANAIVDEPNNNG